MVDGAVTVPLVIVKAAFASAEVEPKLHPPPTPLNVKILKAFVPVRLPPMVFPVVVALNTTVPELFVNAPLLV